MSKHTKLKVAGRPTNIADLSFVRPDQQKGRCFWHVQSTGDHQADGELGQRLALEYLAFEEADSEGPGHLQWIVRDMPRAIGPIETGFLTLVSYAAGAGAHEARRVAAYWESCRAKDKAAQS
jgi:hypothetical protein